MEKHLTVLGGLYVGLGILGIIGFLVVTVIFSVGGSILGMVAAEEPEIPGFVPALIAGFGFFIGLVILVTSLPNFVAAWGLFHRRRWAAPVSLAVGILNLFSFPLGTAVGGYAIWVFLQDGTSKLLNS